MTETQAQQQREQEERLRQARVKNAYALLEKAQGFSAARVEIHDAEKTIVENISSEEEQPNTEARLRHLLRILDIRGEAYVTLVTNLDQQKAVEIMMEEHALWVWSQFSRVPLEALPMLPPGIKGTQYHTDWTTIIRRARHWGIEGHRRLAKTNPVSADKPTRRGYRSEIEKWMKGNGVMKQHDAAKQLGISIDVLKSIMSGKGKKRYSDATVERVLKQIGSGTSQGDQP